MTRQRTSYSIRTTYSSGKIRTHNLEFHYNPRYHSEVKQYTNKRKLSHAKKTLEHCRRAYPDWKHEITKTTTIIEILEY